MKWRYSWVPEIYLYWNSTKITWLCAVCAWSVKHVQMSCWESVWRNVLLLFYLFVVFEGGCRKKEREKKKKPCETTKQKLNYCGLAYVTHPQWWPMTYGRLLYNLKNVCIFTKNLFKNKCHLPLAKAKAVFKGAPLPSPSKNSKQKQQHTCWNPNGEIALDTVSTESEWSAHRLKWN